jgi:hypothetical protein
MKQDLGKLVYILFQNVFQATWCVSNELATRECALPFDPGPGITTLDFLENRQASVCCSRIHTKVEVVTDPDKIRQTTNKW